MKNLLFLIFLFFVQCTENKISEKIPEKVSQSDKVDENTQSDKIEQNIQPNKVDENTQYQKDILKIECGAVEEKIEKQSIKLEDVFIFDTKKTNDTFFQEVLHLNKTIKKPMYVGIIKNYQNNENWRGCFIEVEYKQGYAYKTFQKLNNSADEWTKKESLVFKNGNFFCFDFTIEKMIIVSCNDNYIELLKVLKNNERIDKIIGMTSYKALRLK